MKKILNPTSHGVFDYLMVCVLALAPTALNLGHPATEIGFALAAVYLVFSLMTAYPLSVAKKLSFAYHGVLDFYLSIGIALFGVVGIRNPGGLFFVCAGAIMFLGFVTTDYSEPLPIGPGTRNPA